MTVILLIALLLLDPLVPITVVMSCDVPIAVISDVRLLWAPVILV
jgi:hypothetical protein